MPRLASYDPVEVLALAVARVRARRLSEQPPTGAGDVVNYLEGNYHTQVPGGLIRLELVQRGVLRFMFQPDPSGERRFRFRDLHYSTIKKSGKTAIAGGLGQWSADDASIWGRMGETYTLANDLEQARGRILSAIERSIEQSPGFDVQRKTSAVWRIGRVIHNYRTGSVISAVSGNYRGAAGGNPTLTLYSELWGYIHEASRRLWDEMKPSPVRTLSMRFVETYRGYRGESDLLEERETIAVKNGRQVTAAELRDVILAVDPKADDSELYPFGESVEDADYVPLWVNDAAGLCAYIDEGSAARRMPWQRGAVGDRYYAEESLSNRPEDFQRHHENLWAESTTTALPTEWWDACLDSMPLDPNDRTTPLVMGLDAGVSHDAFAIQVVSRHPTNVLDVVQRAVKIWLPEKGERIDYAPIKKFVRDFCAAHNVVELTADPHELHDMLTELARDGIAWTHRFGQGEARLLADRGLYNLVRDRAIHQLGDPDTREHVQNCAAQVPKGDDTRMRLVKKTSDGLIDLAVALSMAAHECRRLNLG